MPGGRPSSYTPEIAERIFRGLESGIPLERLCRQNADLPDASTIRRWDDPAFCEGFARARRSGTHALADETIDIADDPNLLPADKQVRIQTRLKVIGHWNRAEYGDRQVLAADPDAPFHKPVDVADVLAELKRLEAK